MKSFFVAAVVGLVSATVIAAPASAAGKRGQGGFNPAMLATMAPVAIAAGTALIESGALNNVSSPIVMSPIVTTPIITPGLPITLPGIALPGRIPTDIGG